MRRGNFYKNALNQYYRFKFAFIHLPGFSTVMKSACGLAINGRTMFGERTSVLSIDGLSTITPAISGVSTSAIGACGERIRANKICGVKIAAVNADGDKTST